MTPSDVPTRPGSLPADAQWNDDASEWLQTTTGTDGTVRLRRYRIEGTLSFEGTLADGQLHGPFSRFHRSGAVSRTGEYQNGQIHGIVTCYASPERGDEPLRCCCVPPGAMRMDARFSEGSLQRESFFDGEGHPLLSDGSLRPDRPARISEKAEYEESTQRWRLGIVDGTTGQSTGTWRWWRQDASLHEEADYRASRRIARRLYDESGVMFESVHFLVHEGFEDIVDGDWWRSLDAVQAAPHGDDRIRVIRGHHARGARIGEWSFESADGSFRRTISIGEPWNEESFARILVDKPPTATWRQIALSLFEAGQVRVALVALARAASTEDALIDLSARLQSSCIPLAPASAVVEAERAIDAEGRNVESLLEALVGGADAAMIFRALAVEIGGTGAIGMQLVNASIALAPGRHETWVTRVLLQLERGQFASARADIALLSEHSPEAAIFLDEYLAVLTPQWDFWPTSLALPDLGEEYSLEVAQPLSRIIWAVNLYATRIEAIRTAFSRIAPDASSVLPPSILGTVAVPLRNLKTEIEDEDEEGNAELTAVTIDETVALETYGAPALIRMARASWNALSWLCWSIGCDAVTVPEAIGSHPDYARALNLAIARAWRANDVLVTGGLRARTKGIPSFEWRGHDIDSLPRTLAEFVADEYAEMRAVLLWLTNEGNLSPFQDDLRRV
ncbi:MAG: hypothetical protein SGI86_09320 [Deltaproteobacteria bacterium]|nr:hypothetical protein [Deltaproteobacteria bacterium]